MIESSSNKAFQKCNLSRHQRTIKYFQSSKHTFRNNGWSDEWIGEIIKGIGIEKIRSIFSKFYIPLSLAARVPNV